MVKMLWSNSQIGWCFIWFQLLECHLNLLLGCWVYPESRIFADVQDRVDIFRVEILYVLSKCLFSKGVARWAKWEAQPSQMSSEDSRILPLTIRNCRERSPVSAAHAPVCRTLCRYHLKTWFALLFQLFSSLLPVSVLLVGGFLIASFGVPEDDFCQTVHHHLSIATKPAWSLPSLYWSGF